MPLVFLETGDISEILPLKCLSGYVSSVISTSWPVLIFVISVSLISDFITNVLLIIEIAGPDANSPGL
jgi:hypothetical protein